MKNLGRKMVQRCAGLPIAIILLSGVLSSKESLHDWEMLDRNFEIYKWTDKMHVQEDSEDFDVTSVLGLSYEELPNHLKLCFLHLGHFPNNVNIVVNELCQIWVAEGFVSSEDMAYQCLVELVDRSMVQVVKWGSVPGRIKTCSIHDLMRDFCSFKAEKENFLETVRLCSQHNKGTDSRASGKDVMQKWKDRRLAIYSDDVFADLLALIEKRDESLRTLLCFNSVQDKSYKKFMTVAFKKLRLLRVLKFDNVDPCHVGKLPKGIGKLIHLRLLSLKNVGVDEFPSSMGNLESLQTLDLRISCKGCVKIPNVLWKLGQLKHLYLPSTYKVRSGKLRLNNLSSLQTLVNIRLESCDWDDVSRLINLTKLKVHIDQHGTNFSKLKSIDALDKLQSLSLETHNLVMDFIPISSICSELYKLLLVGDMVKLPVHNQFPQNLVKLSLERSRLHDDPMATLQELPNLRILRLDVDAYVGTTMKCLRGGFPQLENLSLSYLYNFKLWTVKEGALPRLCYLKIEGCKSLGKIPKTLSNITTLKDIVFQWMPREFKENNSQHYSLNNLKGPTIVFLNMSDSDSGT